MNGARMTCRPLIQAQTSSSPATEADAPDLAGKQQTYSTTIDEKQYTPRQFSPDTASKHGVKSRRPRAWWCAETSRKASRSDEVRRCALCSAETARSPCITKGWRVASRGISSRQTRWISGRWARVVHAEVLKWCIRSRSRSQGSPAARLARAGSERMGRVRRWAGSVGGEAPGVWGAGARVDGWRGFGRRGVGWREKLQGSRRLWQLPQIGWTSSH